MLDVHSTAETSNIFVLHIAFLQNTSLHIVPWNKRNFIGINIVLM